MNLTTLANVRQWVGSQSGITTDDGLLTRLIADASRVCLNYMQRPDFGLITITETISGRGEKKIQLRNFPVIAVNSLSIDGVSVQASTSPTTWGYFLEPVTGGTAGRPQNVGIVGSGDAYGCNPYPVGSFPVGYGSTAYMPVNGDYARPFTKGIGNIIVNYTYGYAIQNEAQTIPSSSTYTVAPSAPYGPYAIDNGVSYASGGALTAVASNPTVGQYVAPNLAGDTPTLVYTFAGADAGKAILLNYSYVPYDVEQACIEVVGERYRYKPRIGIASQSLNGQETASYMVGKMLTAAISSRLDAYRQGWVG